MKKIVRVNYIKATIDRETKAVTFPVTDKKEMVDAKCKLFAQEKKVTIKNACATTDIG